MEIDRALIGSVSEPFEIEVEKGTIRRFAEAIGDPNPLFHDEVAARAQGFRSLVAPPTFPVSFRPPKEPEWTVRLDRRRILAGEQSFAYVRPIVAGDVLVCRVHFVAVEEKQGKSGRMELLVQEVRGTTVGGAPVFTHRRITIYREARSAAKAAP